MCRERYIDEFSLNRSISLQARPSQLREESPLHGSGSPLNISIRHAIEGRDHHLHRVITVGLILFTTGVDVRCTMPTYKLVRLSLGTVSVHFKVSPTFAWLGTDCCVPCVVCWNGTRWSLSGQCNDVSYAFASQHRRPEQRDVEGAEHGLPETHGRFKLMREHDMWSSFPSFSIPALSHLVASILSVKT